MATFVTPAVRCALILGPVSGLSGAGLWALMPLVAHHILRGDQSEFGLILGTFGIKSIGGAFFAIRAHWFVGTECFFAVGTLLFAAGTAGAALSPKLGRTLLAAAAASSAWVTVQYRSPSPARWPPRTPSSVAASRLTTCTFGGLAIGSILWSSIAEVTSVATAILILALALGLKLIFSIPLPLPGIVSQETEEALA